MKFIHLWELAFNEMLIAFYVRFCVKSCSSIFLQKSGGFILPLNIISVSQAKWLLILIPRLKVIVAKPFLFYVCI